MQTPRCGRASRLEHGDETTLYPSSKAQERFADGCRVMREIVIHDHAADLAAHFEQIVQKSIAAAPDARSSGTRAAAVVTTPSRTRAGDATSRWRSRSAPRQ